MFLIISVGIRNGCELPSKEGLRAEVESERDIMRNSSGARTPEGPGVSVARSQTMIGGS
jgi:hypothetical protein